MQNGKVKCAIVGSGNIGTDLLIKILRYSKNLEPVMMIGIDPSSDGLARAKRLGIETTYEGIEGFLKRKDVVEQVKIIFEATSARAHLQNAPIYEELGKIAIDLTPAAIGPYVVPPVNLGEHLDKLNVNLITCGGQATIPMVYAVSRVVDVHYAEIVSSVASKSAGPGTRQNIDEFTQTTAKGLEVIGKARKGKAIIILNPAEPPIIMRNTVYTITDECDIEEVKESIYQMVDEVKKYVPGYNLKSEPIFDPLDKYPIKIPGYGEFNRGYKVTILLEIEGAGHYLPKYAGNLDIMTSAALRVGELFAEKILEKSTVQ
ncbi:acetaldehyde dehydrogenase [Candidatus Kryptobacter tengchongensis]|nr:acetaldehyde dehydrogenase [Candidatus Kryptobacter tengchongensis]CUU10182.1 acetaldehyde dehydrogenase [Candidatus Kryptobacter tengchongensis]